MEWFDRLYLGTWQFERQFRKPSSTKIEALLLFALDSGIRRFDTAAVYGEGKVEEILGSCLPRDSVIVTKVPATSKPSLESPGPIRDFYSRDSIHRSVYESLERLRRDSIDTVLLHNWLPTWSSDAIEILQALNGLKSEGVARRVGISMPNKFSAHINEEVLPYVDVIEAPFNPQEQWLLEQLPYLLRLKKEILLRSLFCQGRLLKEQYSVKAILQEVLVLSTSVVIGMTSKEQITKNINYLKENDHE